MAISNSYVELPDGNHHHILTVPAINVKLSAGSPTMTKVPSSWQRHAELWAWHELVYLVHSVSPKNTSESMPVQRSILFDMHISIYIYTYPE